MNRRRILSLALATALAAMASSCAKKSAPEQGPAQYKVLLQTTNGDVVILVHRDWSPLGADHFYELTKAGFYNSNAIFRALPGFVMQWGINGNPQVNKQWSQDAIRDDPPKVSNRIGTIVFAKTGQPDSRTTQVFINLGDNSASLDPQGFTPFGEVIQGMDNVMRFYTGYGEGQPSGSGPSQANIEDLGNSYLRQNFPKLDYIKTAKVVP